MIREELRKHKFIVFGAEHYNPLGIVRSLGEEGIRPIVIIIDGGPPLTSKSKYIQRVHHVKDRNDGLCILVGKYIDKECPAFIYASDDTLVSLLDAHYDELKGKFYFFNAGEKGKLEYYLNKKNIGDLAVKCGLNFLETQVVNNGDIPEKINYPIITKPIDSTAIGWKRDMYICNNEKELKEAFTKIHSPIVMIQRYIIKKNEYCLEGFSCNHGHDLFISIQSSYNYKLPMSYSPYMTVNNFNNMNNVFPGLQAMFREIGFEGIFEVEFLVAEDGKLYFGEINFRNSTWSYASTCAGMNLPILWADSMLLGNQVDNCRKEIGEPGFTAMVELTDFKERVIKSKYSIIKWIKDLKKCKCRYYIGRNDWRPVLSMLESRIIKS